MSLFFFHKVSLTDDTYIGQAYTMLCYGFESILSFNVLSFLPEDPLRPVVLDLLNLFSFAGSSPVSLLNSWLPLCISASSRDKL